MGHPQCFHAWGEFARQGGIEVVLLHVGADFLDVFGIAVLPHACEELLQMAEEGRQILVMI